MFKEPLIYEGELSTICFLIISIIGISLGSTDHFHVDIKRYQTIILLSFLVLSFMLSNILVKRSLNNVALIECFSEWANTKIDYSAENMSLEAGYSYSLMKEALEQKYTLFSIRDRTELKHTLNRVGAAIIITPTVPLNSMELNDLVAFIGSGGRLVVIADHTDLYGHARVLNALLNKFDVRVDYDALFHSKDYYAKVKLLNMHMLSIRPKTPCSLKIGTFGYVFAWADNWISEAADYVRPNFFGELIWTSDDLVGNWPVGAIMTYKKGSIVVWGDSTIFANFCIFQPDHLRLLGNLLEGGEVLAFCLPYCLLLLAFSGFCNLLPYFRKSWIFVYCSLGLILLSGSCYLWNFDHERFYPEGKRIDIYGTTELFDEPPPKRLPRDFQFSSAYSHIARCGLWPLYQGETPKKPVSVKSIWVTPWSQVKTVNSNILNSLWGIVVNKADGEIDIGFKKIYVDDDLAHIFRKYFNESVQRQIWVTQDNSHSLSYNGVSIVLADGVLTDRHLGDWWITARISPYRQYILSEWYDWLINKDKISMFRYPKVGVVKSEQEWIIKFEDRDHANIKMEVTQFKDNKDYVYIGSSIWSLYEKNKDGKFLLGGPELTDDSFKGGIIRWAAKAVNKTTKVK
jgi:hypothetical protein